MVETLNKSQGQILKILVFLLGLFLVLRLPGLSLLYHQDEWKIVSASASAEQASGLAHPPLTQLFFRLDRELFGSRAMRILPLIFSLAAAWLLFVVLRRRLNEKTALISLALFAVTFYNVWASLQIDTDGAILPFFFLLAIYAYDRWRAAPPEWRGHWLVGLTLALLAGFLVKLSFVLVVGALTLDFILTPSGQSFGRRVGLAIVSLIVIGMLFVVALAIINWIYPSFSWRAMLAHASYYAEGGRNYLQIVVQGLKAIFYLSPLLIAPLLFVNEEVFKKLRIFFIYLIFGFIFYFVLFDFSRGALDKYLMFAIVPLVAITATVANQILAEVSHRQVKIGLLIGGLLAVGLMWLNLLPHEVFSLYPKTEWFSRVLTGRWLMLNPFTGGSGPLGFYVSFLFIAGSFILAFIFGLVGWLKKSWRQAALIMILSIGMVYNLVFAEEISFGIINGNASAAMSQAIDFIKQSPRIKSVITYNDIGAYKLDQIGKYAGRFYAAPQFEEAHKARFAKHNQESGYYLIMEIPLLYDGFYKEFFSRCQSLWSARSGMIPAHIYKCQL